VKLNRNRPIRRQAGWRRGKQASVGIEPIAVRVDGLARLVAQVRVKLLRGAGQVGQVRDDQIEAAVERIEQV
jgi:hypothetical protein